MPLSPNRDHFERPIDRVADLNQAQPHLMITSLPGLLPALAT
jgi:hypothetical protein